MIVRLMDRTPEEDGDWPECVEEYECDSVAVGIPIPGVEEGMQLVMGSEAAWLEPRIIPDRVTHIEIVLKEE